MGGGVGLVFWDVACEGEEGTRERIGDAGCGGQGREGHETSTIPLPPLPQRLQKKCPIDRAHVLFQGCYIQEPKSENSRSWKWGRLVEIGLSRRKEEEDAAAAPARL